MTKNLKWQIKTFKTVLQAQHFYCILPKSKISAFLSTPNKCDPLKCDPGCECVYQFTVASTDDILIKWIDGDPISCTRKNKKLGIENQKAISEIYGYGPDALVNVIKMSHFNIDSGTSQEHKDFNRRLLNVFIGNGLSVAFHEGGRVAIEYPQAVTVNSVAIASQLQKTEKRPLFSLWTYIDGSKVLLMVGNLDQSQKFKKFEFKEVKATKFELMVTESSTGITHARLGFIETSDTYSSYTDCSECGGATVRKKNDVSETHTCPVQCKWIPQPWERCQEDCLQFRKIKCGIGAFETDGSQCKTQKPIQEQECFSGNCLAPLGSDKYYEAIRVENQTVKYRMKYENSKFTWNWLGGQAPDGEFHSMIMSIKLGFNDRQEIFELGNINCIIDTKTVTMQIGGFAYLDYNPNKIDTAGKLLFIAIEASDPSQDRESTVSVFFDEWKTEKLRSDWWPGEKSITISPHVDRMFWYAGPVRIPLPKLQQMALVL